MKEVWVQSGQSGPDKKQAPVQLTVFADEVGRVIPTVIFRGKGLRTSAKEKQSYERRVKVIYQEKAWCDEQIMKEWISTEWLNPFKNPIGQNSDGEILIADVHRAQRTVKKLLKKHKIFQVNVPPGCTSRVQVVEVSINRPFKDEIRSLFEDHLDKKLDQYVDVKINASQRRVLMTKWVGEVWSKVRKMKDCIIHSFKKCGFSVALDGSKNNEVNIEGLQEYQMPSAFMQDNKYLLDDSNESEKEDEDKGNAENE